MDWIVSEPSLEGSGSNWSLPLEEKVAVKCPCFWCPLKLASNIDRSFEITGGLGREPPLDFFKASVSSRISGFEKDCDKIVSRFGLELTISYRTKLLFRWIYDYDMPP